MHKCFIVNSPMFFESHWESEIKPHVHGDTVAKIIITGENSHKDLLDNVEEKSLPKLYGGQCECEATCIYSDKGPWADMENKVNFANEATGTTGPNEEFKFNDDEDDQIDLLN